MVVEFECRTRLPVDVQEAFDRSRSIDLHMSSMARSRERAVDGVTTGLIGEGGEVTWRAWHFGVPIRMTSRITQDVAARLVHRRTGAGAVPQVPSRPLVRRRRRRHRT